MKRLTEEQDTTPAEPSGPMRGWNAGQPTVRKTAATVRDAGRERRVIVALYPSGRIGLRLEGLHDEESVTAAWCYEQAVRARVNGKGRRRGE